MISEGIVLENGVIKSAQLKKTKDGISIVKLEEIPLEQFSQEKNSCLVSGISEVIRRDFFLKLTNRRELLKALPFQLEGILPFPVDETVVHPFFYSAKGGTDVVVLATTEISLKSHLENLGKIEPTQISCTPMALLRWAQFVFPDKKQLTLIDESYAIALDEGKLVFSQSFDEKSRVEALFKNKFPSFFAAHNSGDDLRKFATPIGLALEGLSSEGCHFQPLKPQKNLTRTFVAAALSIALFVGVAGSWKLHTEQQELQETVSSFVSTEGSLETQIGVWRSLLNEESKRFPLLPDVPPVKDVFAWIGAIDASIEVVQFHYSLVEYPKAGEKPDRYRVKVDVEFKAADPAAANSFRQALETAPTLIDPNQPVAWNTEKESYKISFILKNIF